MKEIHHGSSASGYTTLGFDAGPMFTVDSLYDYFGMWPIADIINSFNSNTYSIYNHLGHANETNVLKITNTHVDALTNTKPFFIYSQGCYPGDFTVDCISVFKHNDEIFDCFRSHKMKITLKYKQ